MKQRKKQKPLGIKAKRHEVPICRHPHRLATLHLATVHSFSPISMCWTEQRGVRQRCGLFCHVFYCLRLGHKKGCILAKALNAPFVCDFFFFFWLTSAACHKSQQVFSLAFVVG